MKKISFMLVAYLFVVQVLVAASVTTPANIPSYYSSVDDKSGAGLWSAVSSVASRNRSSIGYDGLYNAYKQTDTYPTNSTHPDYVASKAGKMWDMYSNCTYTHGSKKCGSYKGECDCYNREHSIPQSWWGGGTGGIGCDIFHVLPTDGYVNNRRGNYVFGEVSSASYVSGNGSKVGSAKSIQNSKKTITATAGSTTSFSGTVFEPIDKYKGDLARGIMGTMASWNRDLTDSEGSKFFRSSYTQANNFGLTPYGVALLMKWHREDPVSQKEIDRNNGIQSTQGNRNPFIDYPYLAEYIWGEKAGETIDLAQLMPSTDDEFVPSVSNGYRGSVSDDPENPTIKYGLTFMVNGELLRTDSIAENAKPTSLPNTPTSCSTESNIFMGWTTTPISGTTDIAPAILYQKALEVPALKADLILYSVFAHKETISNGQVATTETLDFTAKGLSNQQVITSPFKQNGVTVTFSQANAGTPPTYYESGTAIRLYGGGTMTVASTQITNIAFTFGASDKTNKITADKGTYNNGNWTGTADQVVFTIGGTSGHRRIAKLAVTMNGEGEAEVYNRYITSCQSTTELIETPENEAQTATKVLIGGQLYVRIANALYTITGQRVK